MILFIIKNLLLNTIQKKYTYPFFKNFYNARINNAKEAGKNYKRYMDIPLVSFWFSVIDFYGRVYFKGKVGPQYHNKPKQLKLSSIVSFIG